MPLELLSLLKVARLAIKVGGEQMPTLHAHKEQCTLLIHRSEWHLANVSAQCERGNTVKGFAGKRLSWRLLPQEQMSEKVIIASEAELANAFSVF
ncbi:hypothetical protein CVT25_015386 [Psilocybe cyanescens]|uniref:Uncharacterized protein n=1 Tax=Psilocybe cyanescens TaxID=93625 RepID=A0A409WHC4_PSICY|nr:hypothetical protein CVT25_015386 [Psilocybe cyanescens]